MSANFCPRSPMAEKHGTRNQERKRKMHWQECRCHTNNVTLRRSNHTKTAISLRPKANSQWPHFYGQRPVLSTPERRPNLSRPKEGNHGCHRKYTLAIQG